MKLITIYGSSRKGGNSEALAKIALEQLDNNTYKEIFLLDYNINPIIDERHTEQGFNHVKDDYEELITDILNYDAILFVTPLYWFGMSGRLKNFIDRFSQSLRSPHYDFKESMEGKKVYLIIVGGTMASITALPLVQQFQLITQFMNMEFSGYLIGKGIKPLEVLDDEDSIIAAKQLGKTIRKDLTE